MPHYCGSIGDVYAYEKMESSSSSSSLQPTKAMSFRLPSASPKITSKKSLSFRLFPGRHTLSGSPDLTSRSARPEDQTLPAMAAPSPSPVATAAPAPPLKNPAKRIGFLDVLVCYNSLLQLTPMRPIAEERRQPLPSSNCNLEYGRYR